MGRNIALLVVAAFVTLSLWVTSANGHLAQAQTSPIVSTLPVFVVHQEFGTNGAIALSVYLKNPPADLGAIDMRVEYDQRLLVDGCLTEMQGWLAACNNVRAGQTLYSGATLDDYTNMPRGSSLHLLRVPILGFGVDSRVRLVVPVFVNRNGETYRLFAQQPGYIFSMWGAPRQFQNSYCVGRDCWTAYAPRP